MTAVTEPATDTATTILVGGPAHGRVMRIEKPAGGARPTLAPLIEGDQPERWTYLPCKHKTRGDGRDRIKLVLPAKCVRDYTTHLYHTRRVWAFGRQLRVFVREAFPGTSRTLAGLLLNHDGRGVYDIGWAPEALAPTGPGGLLMIGPDITAEWVEVDDVAHPGTGLRALDFPLFERWSRVAAPEWAVTAPNAPPSWLHPALARALLTEHGYTMWRGPK